MRKKGFTFPEVMAALTIVATVCTVFVQAVIIRVRASEELLRTTKMTSFAAEKMDEVLFGGETERSGTSGELGWEIRDETVSPVRGNPLITMKKFTVIVKDVRSSGGGDEYALSIYRRGT
jgi:prepilin-type N-terminal cleavage/methylation domain-containing protein